MKTRATALQAYADESSRAKVHEQPTGLHLLVSLQNLQQQKKE